MIGCTGTDSNVYLFFEKDDVIKLNSEIVIGIYVNYIHDCSLGSLEVSVNDELAKMEGISTKAVKSDEGIISSMIVYLNQRKFGELMDKKSAGIHEGFRHVELLVVGQLDYSEHMLYNSLLMSSKHLS